MYLSWLHTVLYQTTVLRRIELLGWEFLTFPGLSGSFILSTLLLGVWVASYSQPYPEGLGYTLNHLLRFWVALYSQPPPEGLGSFILSTLLLGVQVALYSQPSPEGLGSFILSTLLLGVQVASYSQPFS